MNESTKSKQPGRRRRGMLVTSNHLAAAIVASLGFAVSLLLLNLGLLVSLVVIVPLYVAVLLITQKREVNLDNIGDTADAGLRQMVTDFLNEHEPRAEALRQMAANLPPSSLRSRAQSVSVLLDKIIIDVRQDPRDVRDARSFLTQTLGPAEAIFRHCMELQQHRGSDVVESGLRRAEASLTALEQAFTKELGRLQEDNLMDLDVEMKVLAASLAQNGYGTPESNTKEQS